MDLAAISAGISCQIHYPLAPLGRGGRAATCQRPIGAVLCRVSARFETVMHKVGFGGCGCRVDRLWFGAKKAWAKLRPCHHPILER